jgi:hypothetical protein
MSPSTIKSSFVSRFNWNYSMKFKKSNHSESTQFMSLWNVLSCSQSKIYIRKIESAVVLNRRKSDSNSVSLRYTTFLSQNVKLCAREDSYSHKKFNPYQKNVLFEKIAMWLRRQRLLPCARRCWSSRFTRRWTRKNKWKKQGQVGGWGCWPLKTQNTVQLNRCLNTYIDELGISEVSF